ncbi:hypothetical protein OEZ85_001614 [Tetradesmus obliquus]|uniref:non-specific serine/threonine protein kinase n=1 Tax=Tetradesmus obliquus TaxID=3088 RepID=A0ABY8U1C2_TETOB|nr:hypothetical protein OEZ85_001614 [Tetradesmus obliquus]
MENYSKGKLLGKGSFGSAWLCTSKLDAKNYVIKEVDISRMPRAERESAEQEAKLLLALKHPNIVRCKECFTSGSKLCIVMDWCSEGDLYSILQKRKGQLLPEDTVLDWFVQICLGLKHVHDRKILHRDLKSQNIFVSSGGLLKLGDFGVSKVLGSTAALASTAVGTPYYLSPEICQNRKYNQKSDMWSLGCVLYEMTAMRQAFEAPNMRALITKIIRGAYSPLPPSRSPELRGLIASLLVLDARKRPSINEVLAAPLLRARIARFLDQTLQVHEFSHTIIHGRPQPGQLVVALQPGGSSSAEAGAGSTPDKADAGGAAAAGGGAGRIRLSAPPAVGLPVRLSAVPPKPAVPRLSGPALRQQPAAPAAAARANLRSPSREQLLQGPAAGGLPAKIPGRAPSPSAAAAAAGQQQQQQRSPLPPPKLSPRGDGLGVAGVKLPSPRGDRPPSGAAAVKLPSPRGDRQSPAAPAAAAAAAVDAARERAQQLQQERLALQKQAEGRRAAEAEAARKAAELAFQQRQAAAAAAAAEVARMRADDQQRAAAAAAARADAERRKNDARQQEQQRQQAQAQARQQAAESEAAARRAAEEARARAAVQRQADEAARANARAAAEAQKRMAAAEAREREQMHQAMQQQRQEFLDRQRAAAANRRRAEDELSAGQQVPAAAAAAAAAAGEVPVHVAPARQRRQRPAWDSGNDESAAVDGYDPPAVQQQPSHRAARPTSAEQQQQQQQQQPVGGRRAAAAGDELSAEQR